MKTHSLKEGMALKSPKIAQVEFISRLAIEKSIDCEENLLAHKECTGVCFVLGKIRAYKFSDNPYQDIWINLVTFDEFTTAMATPESSDFMRAIQGLININDTISQKVCSGENVAKTIIQAQKAEIEGLKKHIAELGNVKTITIKIE